MDRGEHHALLAEGGAGGSLIAVKRAPQDVAWKWTYLVLLALALAGGGYAVAHRNPDFARLASHDYLANPKHCPADAPAPGRRLLLAADGGSGDDVRPTFFLEAAGSVTLVSVAGGLLLGLAALALVKGKPHAMVGLAVGLQVALPAAAGVAVALGSGSLAAASPLLLMAGVLAFALYLYRDQIALVGRLLGVAGQALWANSAALIGGTLLLQLGGLVVMLLLAGSGFAAYANGGVVRNPQVASVSGGGGGDSGGGATCVGADGAEVTCCAWQPDGYAAALIAHVALMLSWSALLVFVVKEFVVASVTARWYFAPVAAGRASSAGALGEALRHAFGPSFGSLAFGSWLLNLLQMLKSAAQSAQDHRDNICAQLLLACAQALLAALEAVTKFAVVRIAITGEALLDACRATTDLLGRNLLDAVGVWWLPGLILQATAVVLSLAWGAAVGVAGYAFWGGGKVAVASGVAAGVVAFAAGALTLTFLFSLLLNVVDAVYICYAMDKDSRACTRVEVHAVYALLPSNHAPMGVVEQPDGGYMFASAAGGRAQPAAPAPYPSPAGYPSLSPV